MNATDDAATVWPDLTYAAWRETLATLHLDRTGEFSPNVDINGWNALTDWQAGLGHRGYNDNCTTVTRNVAANPLLHAQSATYTVTRVEYRNGSVWP